MSLPNPEIWGAQNTWVNDTILYTAGYTGTNELKNIKPKTANFVPNESVDYRSGCIGRGVTYAHVFEWGTPIDPTICPCGQDPAVSAYGKIDVYHNKRNLDQNKIPDYQNIYENENINWFFSSIRIYNQGLRYNKINIDSNVEQWAPNGVQIGAGNVYNNNQYIIPWVYFQIKSLLLQIMVLPINSEYPQQTVETNGAITLDDWRANHSDKKISAVFLKILGCGGVQNNIIGYTDLLQGGYNNGDSVGFSLMNAVNNGTSEITDYATFNYEKNNFIPLVSRFTRGNGFRSNEWTYIFGYHNLDNCELKFYYSAYADDGYGIYPEIAYSDHNYSQIMKMASCFGVAFTPTDKYAFNIRFDDDDLYLPIIGSDGATHGEYTHGAENLLNQLYNLNSIFDFEPMVPVPAERPKQINVYDINEPQNGFDHNGLAILMPIECISDKEELGRWDLTITHPIDDYGKWTYIVGQNVLKVNGQLFRIDETEIYQDADTASITAHAKHITYDLFDRFVDELTVENASGNEYIYKVIQRSQEILPTHRPEPNEYSFSISSNITGPVAIKVQDQTVIGALFGDDNSLAVRYGGRLSRDNFSMSINAPQDNSPVLPAFKLRFGTDLTKLSYKIDFSDWVTELICVDNLGNLWAVSYVGSEWIIHHQKTRRIHFTYDPDTPDPMGCLEKDGYAYWLTVSTPTVSIEVGVAALKNDPKYKDFVDLQNLDVGYTGSVYIEQYNIDVNMKIVSIRRDELTGEAIKVVLGTARGSLIRSPVMSQTIVANGTVLGKQEKIMQSMQSEIENLKLKQMHTWGGMKAYKWADVQQYTWGEIKNGKK